MTTELPPMTDEEIEEELRQLDIEDGDETIEHADTQYSDYPEVENRIQSITVEYDNDESAMYGSDGAKGYDALASERNYEEMLAGALSEAYPGVEIEVTTGYGTVKVDGDTAHAEVDWVNQIIQKTWSSFDWLVESAE